VRCAVLVASLMRRPCFHMIFLVQIVGALSECWLQRPPCPGFRRRVPRSAPVALLNMASLVQRASLVHPAGARRARR
jgi:hypothetical protein